MPTANVLDSYLAYIDTDADSAADDFATSTHPATQSATHPARRSAGPVVVFLHGNPTSSHLWRNVIPHLAGSVRALAPDLIGMGASGKPDIPYDFTDHARYLDAWFNALDLRDVVLVGHDWGGTLGLDWAARHPERVRGVILLEAILKPLSMPELSAPARARFGEFRTPGVGEQLVLEQNILIETAFKGGVLNPLDDEAMAPYRAPYPTPESRRPLLAFTRMLPLDGEPAHVAARVAEFDAWLAASAQVPKLLLTFDSSPTLLIQADQIAWCREHLAALTVEHLGPAGHHAPEDQPDAIGAAIAAWLDARGLAPRP
ncbi:MAG: haloalkane dehalogenase [Actinocrinis sp.]